MATFTITLSGNINESLSIGDAIYTAGKVNALDAGGTDSGIDKNNSSNLPILRGTVTGINNTTNVITVDDGGTTITGNQLANTMALFAKSGVVNTSGISGYYAKIKMKNTSTTEAKLFSVGSEVV
tara:strand:+ start:9124 stop:9498 length:375 start_codon:yes stop_codon:yes gene_type:complete